MNNSNIGGNKNDKISLNDCTNTKNNMNKDKFLEICSDARNIYSQYIVKALNNFYNEDFIENFAEQIHFFVSEHKPKVFGNIKARLERLPKILVVFQNNRNQLSFDTNSLLYEMDNEDPFKNSKCHNRLLMIINQKDEATRKAVNILKYYNFGSKNKNFRTPINNNTSSLSSNNAGNLFSKNTGKNKIAITQQHYIETYCKDLPKNNYFRDFWEAVEIVFENLKTNETLRKTILSVWNDIELSKLCDLELDMMNLILYDDQILNLVDMYTRADFIDEEIEAKIESLNSIVKCNILLKEGEKQKYSVWAQNFDSLSKIFSVNDLIITEKIKQNLKKSKIYTDYEDRIKSCKELLTIDAKIKSKIQVDVNDLKEKMDKFDSVCSKMQMPEILNSLNSYLYLINEIKSKVGQKLTLSELRKLKDQLENSSDTETLKQLSVRIKNGETFWNKLKDLSTQNIVSQFKQLKKEYNDLGVQVGKFEECLLIEEREVYFLSTLKESVNRNNIDLENFKELKRTSKNLKFFNNFESDLYILNRMISFIQERYKNYVTTQQQAESSNVESDNAIKRKFLVKERLLQVDIEKLYHETTNLSGFFEGQGFTCESFTKNLKIFENIAQLMNESGKLTENNTFLKEFLKNPNATVAKTNLPTYSSNTINKYQNDIDKMKFDFNKEKKISFFSDFQKCFEDLDLPNIKKAFNFDIKALANKLEVYLKNFLKMGSQYSYRSKRVIDAQKYLYENEHKNTICLIDYLGFNPKSLIKLSSKTQAELNTINEKLTDQALKDLMEDKIKDESMLTKRGDSINVISYGFLNEFNILNEKNKNDPTKSQDTKDYLALLTMDVFTQQDLEPINCGDNNKKLIQQNLNSTERNLNFANLNKNNFNTAMMKYYRTDQLQSLGKKEIMSGQTTPGINKASKNIQKLGTQVMNSYYANAPTRKSHMNTQVKNSNVKAHRHNLNQNYTERKDKANFFDELTDDIHVNNCFGYGNMNTNRSYSATKNNNMNSMERKTPVKISNKKLYNIFHGDFEVKLDPNNTENKRMLRDCNLFSYEESDIVKKFSMIPIDGCLTCKVSEFEFEKYITSVFLTIKSKSKYEIIQGFVKTGNDLAAKNLMKTKKGVLSMSYPHDTRLFIFPKELLKSDWLKCKKITIIKEPKDKIDLCFYIIAKISNDGKNKSSAYLDPKEIKLSNEMQEYYLKKNINEVVEEPLIDKDKYLFKAQPINVHSQYQYYNNQQKAAPRSCYVEKSSAKKFNQQFNENNSNANFLKKQVNNSERLKGLVNSNNKPNFQNQARNHNSHQNLNTNNLQQNQNLYPNNYQQSRNLYTNNLQQNQHLHTNNLQQNREFFIPNHMGRQRYQPNITYTKPASPKMAPLMINLNFKNQSQLTLNQNYGMNLNNTYNNSINLNFDTKKNSDINIFSQRKSNEFESLNSSRATINETANFVTPDLDFDKNNVKFSSEGSTSKLNDATPNVSKFHFSDKDKSGSNAKMIEIQELSEGTMNKFGEDACKVDFAVSQFSNKNLEQKVNVKIEDNSSGKKNIQEKNDFFYN